MIVRQVVSCSPLRTENRSINSTGDVNICYLFIRSLIHLELWLDTKWRAELLHLLTVLTSCCACYQEVPFVRMRDGLKKHQLQLHVPETNTVWERIARFTHSLNLYGWKMQLESKMMTGLKDDDGKWKDTVNGVWAVCVQSKVAVVELSGGVWRLRLILSWWLQPYQRVCVWVKVEHSCSFTFSVISGSWLLLGDSASCSLCSNYTKIGKVQVLLHFCVLMSFSKLTTLSS